MTQTDGNGNTTAFVYNVMNKQVKKMSPVTVGEAPKVELYTYNADGTLKNKIDRNGKTTNYTYDVLGRMLSQTIGTESIAYTYDANGNTLIMTDATGTTTWTYDTLGRALTKTVPNIGTSTYEYDLVTGIAGLSAGNYAESTTDPKGNITIKIYDKMDRVISVDDGTGITQFTYYDNGSRKSVLYPDGSNETYVYDENGQNTALVNRKADNTLIDTYSYIYDAANHQTSKTDAKGTTTFTYDKLGRLATITEPSGIKTAYTYDKAGNRIGEKKFIGEVLTQDTQYRYDASNRLLSTETKSQILGTTDRVTYTYDANGNMLSQMTTSIKPAEIGNQATFVLEKSGASPNTLTRFTYDSFNQLKSSDDGTNKITYAYNGLGYRVEKSVTTGSSESPTTRTSRYLYEYDKVVLEVDANGNEIAKNTYGTNLLSREMADITVYYMYNGHGDVTALLNTAGDTVATYYYDIWGNILEKMESASVSNPFRYAGYQYDEETDLYYLNARYYDAKIARFLTEDTYTGRQNDPLSLNLYTYCHNEPVMYKDPSGNVNVLTADGYGTNNTKKGTDKNYSVYNNGSTNQINNDSTKNKTEAAKEKAAEIAAEKARIAALVAKKEKDQKAIDEKAAKDKAAKDKAELAKIEKESKKSNEVLNTSSKEKTEEKIQNKMITIAESIDVNDPGSIYKGLQLTLSATQSLTNDEEKGAALLVVGGEATMIIGISGNHSYVYDASDKKFETSNISLHAKSNAEVCGGVKLVVYPYLSDSSKLLGWGLNAGVEGGFAELGTLSFDFTNLEPEGFNVAVQLGNGITLPLPADVYVGVGYTQKNQSSKYTQYNWYRLNNMNLGCL